MGINENCIILTEIEKLKRRNCTLNDEENWVMIEFVLVGDAEEMESRDAIVDKGELRIVFTVQAKSVLTNFNG